MLSSTIVSYLTKFGIRVSRHIPSDFESRHVAIIKTVAPNTLTSPERLHALIEAVRYVINNRVEGAFVECGVYKGGSMMAVALALLELGVSDRQPVLVRFLRGYARTGGPRHRPLRRTCREGILETENLERQLDLGECATGVCACRDGLNRLPGRANSLSQRSCRKHDSSRRAGSGRSPSTRHRLVPVNEARDGASV